MALLGASWLPAPASAGDGEIPWCGTDLVWQRRAPLIETFGNPCAYGSCDDPETRDGTEAVPLYLPVIVHVMRRDDGTGGIPQSAVDATIARLNSDFLANETQVRFILLATRFHDDSELECIGGELVTAVDQIDSMKRRYAEQPATACNIFISCQAASPPTLLGVGTFPWDPRAPTVFGGIWLNSVAATATQHVLTHEMGHCLGLWHTFHGVSEVDGCDDPCYEFASGFEGDLRGDLASDTPPAPRTTSCAQLGGEDCQGTPWGTTQPENFMSYARYYCQSLFTAQQTRRMQCWTPAGLPGWTTFNTDVPPVEGGGTVLLHPARPNPFRRETTIRWTQPAPQRVRLRVLDAAGRRVRILSDQVLEAGTHAVAWDGRDPSGERVAAGIYFCTIDAGATRGTVRLIFIP